jgi:hypothetical protein
VSSNAAPAEPANGSTGLLERDAGDVGDDHARSPVLGLAPRPARSICSVLTLAEQRISAITWFGERSLMADFGLPRTLPE